MLQKIENSTEQLQFLSKSLPKDRQLLTADAQNVEGSCPLSTSPIVHYNVFELRLLTHAQFQLISEGHYTINITNVMC